jgi:hypothetical protein
MHIVLLFLALSFSVPALAQTEPAQQQTTTHLSSDDAAKKPAAAATSQQPAQNNLLAEGNQPTSLGDLARLARAKKKDEPKAAKVIDDENMPRGRISIRRKRSRLQLVILQIRRKTSLARFLGLMVWAVPRIVARPEAISIRLQQRPGASSQHQRGSRRKCLEQFRLAESDELGAAL